jgi:hypothetical protein
MEEIIRANILKILQSEMSGMWSEVILEQSQLIRRPVAKYLEAMRSEREIHHKWLGRAKVLPDPGRW